MHLQTDENDIQLTKNLPDEKRVHVQWRMEGSTSFSPSSHFPFESRKTTPASLKRA